MTTIDVNAIEQHVQNLRNTIRSSFDQRVDSAKVKLSSAESALSKNRNHHQAGLVSELTDALTRLQEQCSTENKTAVIQKVEHIQRLFEDPHNRSGWHLPKKEWPIEPDDVLLSVSLCIELVELQENAEALLSLSKKIAIDIEQLSNSE